MANKGISTGHIALDELPEALTGILTDFQHANFEARQQAVQKGAEVFKDAVEAVTPRDTGEMAQSWQRLIDGKDIQPHDITLLQHEIMEKELMDAGYTQDAAHTLTSHKFNYAEEAYKYYYG